MDEIEIPQLIDNFPQIMWWEADEMVPLIVGMMFGAVFDMFTPAMVGGAALSAIYVRYKRNALPGSLHHMCFWWGVLILNYAFKNGLNRESEQ